MLRKGLLIIGFAICCFCADAATIFRGAGGKLDTTAAGIYFPLKISWAGVNKLNHTFGFEYVNVKINCASTYYLTLSIISPDGVEYPLSSRVGSGKNYDSTFFTDTALTCIDVGKSPFKGTYSSESFLREINNGQTGNGTWYLHVYDANTLRKDVLANWSIGFSSRPLQDVILDSSNLPIIVVNTRGQIIPGADPMANSFVSIIDRGSGKYNFTKDSSKFKGYGGIELHGNWSRSFPKLSYSLQNRDQSWNPKDTVMLGFPKGKDWALLANYLDRSLLRNAISHHLFASMGNYDPRFRHVELILNGAYQGVYLLIEKIKVSADRVNIAKLDTAKDTTGDALTGGYMIKEDWKGSIGWYSKYYKPDYTTWYPYFRFDQPSLPSIKQQNYIHSFYDSFENTMYGAKVTSYPGNWRKYADEKTFTDFFFTQEITRNVDGYRASFYMWKDRNSRDRHIHLGPVWDFDITLGDYWSSFFAGWHYSAGWNSDFWWYKLMGVGGYGKGDGSWKNNLKCRWTVYRRGPLNSTNLDHWIDSNATLINAAQVRNFKEWPEFGMNLPIGEPTTAKTYIQEVDTLKNWMHRRMKWLDKYMPGTCYLDIDPPTVKLNGKDTLKLEVDSHFVNPGITYHDNFGDTNVKVIWGSNLDSSVLGTYVITYFLSDKAGNSASIFRVVKVIDTLPPTITFVHGDTIKTEVYQVYQDTDVIIKDNYDTSLIKNKWGTFNFKNNIPDSLGFYSMWYKAKDKSGNVDSAMRTIQVVDTLRPTITFNGTDTVKVEVYYSYSDTDVHFKDNYDTLPILSHSGTLKNYKTDSLGYFTIVYKCIDKSGNSVTKMRVVNVIDSIAPLLKLAGMDSVSVYQDSIYNDSGYIASDNYDKRLRIDTSGDYVNTLLSGVFHRIYTAKDQSNNKSLSVNRVITVVQASGIANQNDANKAVHIFPNPGKGEFKLSIFLPQNAKAILTVYDAMGRELEYLRHEVYNGYNGTLHLENEALGVYTLKLQGADFITTTKLILMK